MGNEFADVIRLYLAENKAAGTALVKDGQYFYSTVDNKLYLKQNDSNVFELPEQSLITAEIAAAIASIDRIQSGTSYIEVTGTTATVVVNGITRMTFTTAGTVINDELGTAGLEVSTTSVTATRGTKALLVDSTSARASNTTGDYTADATGNIVVNKDILEAELAGITYSASDITADRIAGSTYSTVQHMQDIFHSSGRSSGGTITDAGSGTVNISAGTGFIRPTNNVLDTLLFHDWNASNGVAIGTNTTTYIGVQYNVGAPNVFTTTNYADFNYNTNYPLGVVVRNGTTTLHITQNPHTVGDHASLMIQRNYETVPLARDVRGGGLIIGESGDGNRYVTLTAGAIWDKLNRFLISSYDTNPAGGADTFTAHYSDGAGAWTEAPLTQWPNTQYDNGTGILATMANNKWANLWFYVEVEDHLDMVYGTAEYNSLAEAQGVGAPSSIPTHIAVQGKLVGRISFQKSATTGTVQSNFTSLLTLSGASDHNSLGGLQGGTAGEYYHLTSAQLTNTTSHIASASNPHLTDIEQVLIADSNANGQGVENLGRTLIGTAVDKWGTSWKNISLGLNSDLSDAFGESNYSFNVYRDNAAARKYKNSNFASYWQLGGGGGGASLFVAPSGTADVAITFNQALRSDSAGVITLPALTTALIAAESTGKVAITREYGDANYKSCTNYFLGVYTNGTFIGATTRYLMAGGIYDSNLTLSIGAAAGYGAVATCAGTVNEYSWNLKGIVYAGESITIKLYLNGTEKDTVTITTGESGSRTVTTPFVVAAGDVVDASFVSTATGITLNHVGLNIKIDM